MPLYIAIDFDQNDWVALYSNNSDAPNLIGAVAVKASDLRRQPTGVGGSAAAGSDFERYGLERAAFGKDRVNWTTGTTTNCFINLGYNGASFETGLMSRAAGTYSVSLYAKLNSGSSTDTFSLVLTNATSANYAVSSATALNSSTWTRLLVTGVTPSTQNLCLQMYRVTGSTSKIIEMTAPMLFSGSAVSHFNCGTLSLLEPVTAYAMEATWDLGFKAAYQYVPPIGRATIQLTNDSKRFSPEFAAGPLHTDLVPGLLVQIGDPAYGIKWTGWTEAWKPTPGLYGPRDCAVTATDGRAFLESQLPLAAIKASLTIGALVFEYMFSNGGVAAPNTSEKLPVGSPDDVIHLDSIPGETVPYYGDANKESDKAIKIISDLVSSIQGKFWFARTGGYDFYSSQGDDTPASFVNIAARWMTAVYSDVPIINECNVSIFRRKASASAVQLWDLDEQIVLAAGESESFRVFFRNTTSDNILVGALSAGLAITHTASGISTTSALSAISAQSALVTFTNASAGSRTILTASITGTRIVALREIFKRHEDTASKTAYGLNAETLRLNWVQSRQWGAKLAKYRVERFKNPRKVITQIKLNAVDMPSEVFALNIGRAVYVTDVQTAHAGYYVVIGEAHSARQGLTNQVVTFHLEPLYATTVAATVL